MSRKKKPKGGTLTDQAREAMKARADIVASAHIDGPGQLLVHGIEDKAGMTPLMHYEAEGITEPPPLTTDEAIQDVLQDRADHLEDAPIFLLSEEMLDVVIAAAKSLSPDDLAGLTEEDLPQPTGFLMLPRDIYVSDPTGTVPVSDIRAFSWRFGDICSEGVWSIGARVALWSKTEGGEADAGYRATLDALRGSWLPDLVHIGATWIDRSVFAGMTQAEMAQEVEAARDRLGHLDLPPMEALEQGVHSRDDVIDDRSKTFPQAFLFAFSRLCEQGIGEDETVGERIPAVARKGGPTRDVRVVTLRKRRARTQGESEAVEWSHRWVVQMHKRRQWYPSIQGHKVIFVGPFVKGPEGKPLKPASTGVTAVR